MKTQQYFLKDKTNDSEPFIYQNSKGEFTNSECSEGCIYFSSIEEGENYIEGNELGDWAYISEEEE